jgi:hypothetical protein
MDGSARKSVSRRVIAEFVGMDATKLTEQRLQAYVAPRRKKCGVEQTKRTSARSGPC